jgi:hypothetical protein
MCSGSIACNACGGLHACALAPSHALSAILARHMQAHELFMALKPELLGRVRPPSPQFVCDAYADGCTPVTTVGRSGKIAWRQRPRPFVVISSTSWTPDEDFEARFSPHHLCCSALPVSGCAAWHQRILGRQSMSRPVLSEHCCATLSSQSTRWCRIPLRTLHTMPCFQCSSLHTMPCFQCSSLHTMPCFQCSSQLSPVRRGITCGRCVRRSPGQLVDTSRSEREAGARLRGCPVLQILLEACIQYERESCGAGGTKGAAAAALPPLLVIITGRGPQQAMYCERLAELRLEHVSFHLAWFAPRHYFTALGSADLGVSLHASSSDLDLPMKVSDMLGRCAAHPLFHKCFFSSHRNPRCSPPGCCAVAAVASATHINWAAVLHRAHACMVLRAVCAMCVWGRGSSTARVREPCTWREGGGCAAADCRCAQWTTLRRASRSCRGRQGSCSGMRRGSQLLCARCLRRMRWLARTRADAAGSWRTWPRPCRSGARSGTCTGAQLCLPSSMRSHPGSRVGDAGLLRARVPHACVGATIGDRHNRGSMSVALLRVALLR